MSLDHDQSVSFDVLMGHVPRRFGVPRSATNLESATLAERIEGEPVVSTQPRTVGGEDRARGVGDVLIEKLAEGALANETNSGAVGFIVNGKARRPSPLAYLEFRQLTEREQGRLEL